MARVDEAFSYLRSQSEGKDVKDASNNSNEIGSEMIVPNDSEKSSSNSNLTKSYGVPREERAGSITISDAVLDSSKDYDSLEPEDIEKDNSQIDNVKASNCK